MFVDLIISIISSNSTYYYITVTKKGKIRSFASKIKSVNEVLEQAPRFAEFLSTKEHGGSDMEAMYNSAEVTTNFNGEWLTLGDGQLLTTYILQKQEDFTDYIIPVQANEKESSLYVRVTKDSIDIEGISFEPRNNSFSGRMCPITEGITITPIYDVWNEEEKTYDTVYGEEYSLKGTDDVLYTYLENGEYSYATIVDNMLGTVLCSKPMKFTMIDKKISFTE